MRIETYAMLYPTMRRMDYELEHLFGRIRDKTEAEINYTQKTIRVGGKRIIFMSYDVPWSPGQLRGLEISGFDIESPKDYSMHSKRHYEEAFQVAQSRLRRKERFDDVESFLGLTKEDGDESGEA